MASSNLKLVIQKGPRQGETLEFKPRSSVRIGRVVKGNNITIKDQGISSKHLKIEFNSDSGNWEITDLESSNGTILNSTQLNPFSPTEINHADEIKLGELTSIRVEIVEISEDIGNRRNPRKQAASKSSTVLRGRVEDGLNLGENVEIREEIDNRRNPRRRAAVKIGSNLGSEVEEGSNLGESVKIREEVNSRRNPRRQAASRKGHEVEVKVEVLDEDCEAESYMTNRDLEEQNMEKGVDGNRRGCRRGRPKKVSCLVDENADDMNLGVSKNVEISTTKPEGGVSTRSTRRTKKAEDVMEKVAESKVLGMDHCKEVENISLVENKKTRGGRGRKKKVDAECLDNVQDPVVLENMIPEVSEKEVPGKVVVLREEPCEEPVGDALEQNILDDQKNEKFMEVEGCKQREDALSVRDMDEIEQPDECVALPVSEQYCADFVEQPNQQDDCVALPVSDQHRADLTDELNQQDDSVVDPSLVEGGLCDGVESNALSDEEKREVSEYEEVDEEMEANCSSRSKELNNTDVPDLEKMTLGDWFDFLEVYLPKQIYTARDQIIEDMRKRARQFDDFMLQHQKDKSKLPLPTEKAKS
ncbi:FHA domain-containing protein At4g14490 [Beta vulgaris subsp. vulgaris]|uniref:FHA domain-containing protein At4g14490 n=1 Tax=Beta vulgaris subsp. vulgaris TaxID=3555 RepID=UPI002036BA0C|nr:FHA domain-containing protein At4g14490 [Beta vulgaris subsp. vulgaris]XP_019106271.2 FHA domain-containing protein At4g14490 [Beta vulgaris subsp. vulgaris]